MIRRFRAFRACLRPRVEFLFRVVVLVVLAGLLPLSSGAQPTDRSVAILEIPDDDGSIDPIKTHGAEYMARVAGVPFRTTTSLDTAARYAVTLATSGIDSETFTDANREKVRAYVRDGGVFVAANFKDPDLFETFGITGEDYDRTRHRLSFQSTKLSNAFDWIDTPREETISLGDTSRTQAILTRSYTPQDATVLARFEDGSAAITRNEYGEGAAYLLGVSLRDVTVRNHLNMDFSAQRSYSNGFEPSTDVFPLFLRSIVRTHVPHTVWKHTSPYDTQSTVMITHDVDGRTGMELMNRFAAYEQRQGITANYFITTHYINDHLAGDYYTPYRDSIRKLEAQGQRIGSHSVGHFPDFDELPYGTPGNTRSTYSPGYNGDETVGGSVYGELEVSQALLEANVPQKVITFRAGYLLYPDSLINALDALGYRFNTTLSANNVMASFPYRGITERSFNGTVSNIWEIPVTISDVFDEAEISADNYPEKVDQWIDAYRRYADNGAPVSLLIHPNRTFKLEAEKAFVERLPSDVALLSTEAFGRYWATRTDVDVDTRLRGETLTIQLENQTTLPDSLSLVVDDGSQLDEIKLRNKNGASLSHKSNVRLDGSLLIYSASPARDGLVAEASATVSSTSRVDFGDTGVDISFFGTNGAGVVRTQKYESPPTSTTGISEANVSDYRYVISAGNGLAADSMRVYVEARSLSGLTSPDSVVLYQRPAGSSVQFERLPTTVDPNDTPNDPSDDEVYATTNELGEFVLASNTSPLPVDLSALDATWTHDDVRLTWATASESSNAGFRVQRRGADESWTSLGFVEGHGTTTQPTSYRFTDRSPPFQADSLRYRLVQVDRDGSTSPSEPVVLARTSPKRLELRATYPNPARSWITVQFAVPSRQRVVLTMHDVLGRRVARLERATVPAGRDQLQLDVSELSSGIYFLRLKAEDQIRTQKVTIVR